MGNNNHNKWYLLLFERMLSKAKIKFVQSLRDKKHRNEHQLFVAEGAKIVPEVLASKIRVKSLFATSDWLEAHSALMNIPEAYDTASAEQLKQMSALQTPPDVLVVAEMPQSVKPELFNGLTLVLDTIQDPGNLGTIIRIADWYGISCIICSEGCADVFNPKVIQASMGSFTRVNVVYMNELEKLFQTHKHIPVYGALLEGESLYETIIESPSFLLLGNEGSGITEALTSFITHPVTIPKRGGAESLNVAVATAVLCDAWSRGATSGK